MNKIFLYSEIDQLIKKMDFFVGQNFGLTGLYGQPIHAGHIDLIKGSASNCDMLIIALSNDEMSVRKNGQCFMSWKDRTEILQEMYSVDWIIENPFPTMKEILSQLPVQYYFKGGDVREENLLLEEKEVCQQRGIKIFYEVGGGKSQSSSILLENYWRYRQQNHEFVDCLNKLKDI